MDLNKQANNIINLAEIEAQKEEMVKAIKLAAEFNKEYFNACIKSGFTEAQALELTKTHGLNYGRGC